MPRLSAYKYFLKERLASHRCRC